jgi:hypothetical protein
MQRVFLLLLGMVMGSRAVAGGAEASSARPHLFFDAAELAELRVRVTAEPYRERWAQLEQAAKVLRETAPAARSRENLGIMGTLAFVYAITAEASYAQRALVEAREVIARDEWVSPRHARFTLGVDLVAAEQSLGLALVYDWCHGAFTEAERGELRRALEHVLALYAISVDPLLLEWWFEDPINNWRGVCHGGLGVAALALYHESAEARRLAEISRREIPRVFREVVRRDGGGDEGVGYHHYGLTYAVTALMAQRKFFGEAHVQESLRGLVEKRAGYWDVLMQGPDLDYANLGRMGGDWGRGLWGRTRRNGGGPHAELCALWDAVTPGGDELLRWGADNGSSRFYWPGASPFWFLWRRAEAPSLTGAPRPTLGRAVLFPETGHAIWQDGGLWLALSGGRNHNRMDLGAFVLVVGEERFIHLPGSLQDLRTGDQSTGLINGRGQVRDSRAGFRRFGAGEGFLTMAVELGGVYDDPSLARFTRHLVMVEGRFLVVVDEWAASRPAHFEVRWQTEKTGLTVADGVGRIVGENAHVHVITAGDRPVRLTAGQGALRHLKLSPVEDTERAVLVSVLWPGGADEVPPAVRWTKDARVIVGDTTIEFERGEAGLEVVAVDGRHAQWAELGAPIYGPLWLP